MQTSIYNDFSYPTISLRISHRFSKCFILSKGGFLSFQIFLRATPLINLNIPQKTGAYGVLPCNSSCKFILRVVKVKKTDILTRKYNENIYDFSQKSQMNPSYECNINVLRIFQNPDFEGGIDNDIAGLIRILKRFCHILAKNRLKYW